MLAANALLIRERVIAASIANTQLLQRIVNLRARQVGASADIQTANNRISSTPRGLFEFYPVSTRVNGPKNDGPSLSVKLASCTSYGEFPVASVICAGRVC
jgi:hypothetical protein